jgi:hypothetical protein
MPTIKLKKTYKIKRSLADKTFEIMMRKIGSADTKPRVIGVCIIVTAKFTKNPKACQQQQETLCCN